MNGIEIAKQRMARNAPLQDSDVKLVLQNLISTMKSIEERLDGIENAATGSKQGSDGGTRRQARKPRSVSKNTGPKGSEPAADSN